MWDQVASNFNVAQHWWHDYVNKAYSKAIELGFAKIDFNKDKIHVLKTDLWNEVVEVNRDIISPIFNKSDVLFYGMDISEKIVMMGKEKFRNRENVTLFKGDIRHIPTDSGIFDVVIDLSTLDHIPEIEIEKALKEYNRVMKKNGILILVCWYNSFSVKRVLLPFLKYFLRLNDPFPQYYFSLENLLEKLRQNFYIIESYYIGSILCYPFIGKPLSFLPQKAKEFIIDNLIKIEYSKYSKFLKELCGITVIIGRKV